MPWRNFGGLALEILAALLLWPGCDCLRVGLRDLRRETRSYDRRLGLATMATGVALLVLGIFLFWGGWALRR